MDRPICNRRPETQVVICGCRSPLCARCTFLVLGYSTTLAATFAFGSGLETHIATVLLLVSAILCGVDGYFSYWTVRSTTNTNRAITGGFLGASIACFEFAFGVSPIQWF